jgi:hypothetical protein
MPVPGGMAVLPGSIRVLAIVSHGQDAHGR